jgi:hypothetical protein
LLLAGTFQVQEEEEEEEKKKRMDARCVAGTGSWSVGRAPRALTPAAARLAPRRTPRFVHARYARRTHREACADVAFGSARCRSRASRSSYSVGLDLPWTALNQWSRKKPMERPLSTALVRPANVAYGFVLVLNLAHAACYVLD